MEPGSAQEIWDAALGELQVQVSRPNYRTWLEKTVGLAYKDNEFVIGVPNTFVAEYLDNNQRSLIEKTLIGLTSPEVRVVFRVNAASKRTGKRTARAGGNRRYTFDSFVVTSSNRLAYAAALSVAENPGSGGYNPLYICGGAGLGKTHLLHAIYNMSQQNNVNSLFVSAEQFTNDFVCSVRERSTEDFRAKYRSVDMLLMDDVQFIGGKEQTEESFFHTFNELHDANRQIVVTSNRPPRSMPVKDQLSSRFEWGLVAPIQPPDIKSRLAILKAKAEEAGGDIPLDVLETIARQVKHNIRELEGCLHQASAYARMLGVALTPQVAVRAAQGFSDDDAGAPPSSDRVLEAVASSFQMTADDLKGRRRDRETALARQIAMYLLKEATGCSLAQIGLEMGNRDHSTVTHACQKIAGEAASNPQLQRRLTEIQKTLSPNPRAAAR